ncbi:MAG: tetratricopeptide repeat protein [Methanoculleus sp.]|jgi:tetratricopeptide (TPR) repeat protein
MAKKLDPMAMRVAMERSLIDTRALVQNKNFESLEEANAYLQEVLKEGGPPPAPADTPLKRAQQIAYDAMEASGRRRVVLARRALEVSEDCADAWVLLAEEQRSLKAALEYAQKGVAAGERALGEEYFEEGVGCFWGDVDTRPYMRALMLYADILWAVGDKDEAIEVYQKMLRLNPGDNQGVRHILAMGFAEADRDDVFEALLEEYEGDPMAAFMYSEALWLFRKEGAGSNADAALDEAMEGNPFVPRYLLGRRKLPARLPDYHGLGDRDEAVAYVSNARKGWVVTQGALAWLKSHFLARSSR